MSANTVRGSDTSATMALLHMAAAGWISQSVHVAAKLGIADILESGPKTPHQIATITGSHSPALHRLLRMLASLGMTSLADLFVSEHFEAGQTTLGPVGLAPAPKVYEVR